MERTVKRRRVHDVSSIVILRSNAALARVLPFLHSCQFDTVEGPNHHMRGMTHGPLLPLLLHQAKITVSQDAQVITGLLKTN